MNSREIFKAIEQVAATSSKNEKQSLVTKFAADENFRTVLEYAYNPFKTFGVKQMPKKENSGSADFTESIWEMLNALIGRTLTGNEARGMIQAMVNVLNDESAELLIRILRKDLRAGFSESTCNKAVKGLIPTFPYMRCCLNKDVDVNTYFAAGSAISEEKADGEFANVNHEEGGVVYATTRQGTPFPAEVMEPFYEEARRVLTPGTQTHGEFLVTLDGKIMERALSNGVMNRIINGGEFKPGESLIYKVWDQIPLSFVVPKGRFETPYKTRLGALLRQVVAGKSPMISPIEIVMCKDLPAALAHYRQKLAEGKEGTVLKNPMGIWRDTGSSGSKDQCKMKLEVDVDLEIIEVVPGREGTKNEGRAGSLKCATSDRLLFVDVTIKNEDMRDRVDANFNDFEGRIIVVRSNAINAPSESNPLHSLFLPRFATADYRLDKNEADSLQRVKDQFDSAIKGE